MGILRLAFRAAAGFMCKCASPNPAHVLLPSVCGMVLVALVSVGILGLAFGAAAGGRCTWCQSVACVDTPWWTCQSTLQPMCSYQAFGNGTAHIDCIGVCFARS